jgi:hypothetical protein
MCCVSTSCVWRINQWPLVICLMKATHDLAYKGHQQSTLQGLRAPRAASGVRGVRRPLRPTACVEITGTPLFLCLCRHRNTSQPSSAIIMTSFTSLSAIIVDCCSCAGHPLLSWCHCNRRQKHPMLLAVVPLLQTTEAPYASCCGVAASDDRSTLCFLL